MKKKIEEMRKEKERRSDNTCTYSDSGHIWEVVFLRRKEHRCELILPLTRGMERERNRNGQTAELVTEIYYCKNDAPEGAVRVRTTRNRRVCPEILSPQNCSITAPPFCSPSRILHKTHRPSLHELSWFEKNNCKATKSEIVVRVWWYMSVLTRRLDPSVEMSTAPPTGQFCFCASLKSY